MTSSDSERDFLEEQLKVAGNELLNPPSSLDDLLILLDKLENLLTNVEQAPSKSMLDALLPSMKALIANELLRHSEMDVKVSVASCVTEITRITAPDAPYSDDQMKEIFQLTVAAFEKLSHVSSRCYTKAFSILDTVAKVRSCLVMLDLECDALVVEMFQHFLKIIRSNHPHAVFSAMETIMTVVIDESEEISLDLLSPLLASVRKENQGVSPISWKLGEKVISSCAAKLKPYLKEAVQSTGIALDDYAQILTSVCQSEPDTLEHEHVNGSREHLADENKLGKETDLSEPPRTNPNDSYQVTKGLLPDNVCPTKVGRAVDGTFKSLMSNGTALTRDGDTSKSENSSKILLHCALTKHSKSIDARSNVKTENLESTKAAKSEIETDSVAKKRGRKPNSLMNPEEGYDHSWISTGRKTSKSARSRKFHDSEVDGSPSENPVPKKATSPSTVEKVTELSRFQPKTDEIINAASPSPDHYLPDASRRRRGQLKKKGSMMNQDADPNSLSVLKGELLNVQVVEKAAQSTDISLKKESGVTNSLEAKPQGRSRKFGIATKTSEETTQAPRYVVSEKKAAVPCGPVEKPLQLSDMNVGIRNTNDRSSVQTDIKKRKRGDTSEKDTTEASGCKMISKSATKSTNRDETYLEETPKTELKRKRTTAKEAFKRHELDERLVGCRIEVWWPIDKAFYEGVIYSYDPVKKKHLVLYADGDEEMLNLNKERWELIGDGALPDDSQETDLPKADASSEIAQKRKGKAKSESAKQANADDSSSKRGRASASISKVDSRKSGGKSADDDVKLDNRTNVNESLGDPSRMDNGSKGSGRQKSAVKSSIERRKTGIDPRQTMAAKGFL